MFLGPLEQSKAWDTNGIDGVHKFLRRFWRLFFDRDGRFCVTDEKARRSSATLHKTIKKVPKTSKTSRSTLRGRFHDLPQRAGRLFETRSARTADRADRPFAPHIAEELWEAS